MHFNPKRPNLVGFPLHNLRGTVFRSKIIALWYMFSSISILLNGHRMECKLLYVEQLHRQFRVCRSIHTKKMKIHVYRKVSKQKVLYQFKIIIWDKAIYSISFFHKIIFIGYSYKQLVLFMSSCYRPVLFLFSCLNFFLKTLQSTTP